MSKKTTAQQATVRHKDCRHCRPYTKDFLQVGTHDPVLGACEYEEYLFPLNEKTNCQYYRNGNKGL